MERKAAARAAGIAEANIALDPGVGFGKTMADNWRWHALRIGRKAEDDGAGCLAEAFSGDARARGCLPCRWSGIACGVPALTEGGVAEGSAWA